jgi:hypothetical protein
MQRDELLKAPEAQPMNADVQICIGAYLVDVDSVDFVKEREAIVIRMRGDDLRDVIGHVTTQARWWRGSLPGGLDGPED